MKSYASLSGIVLLVCFVVGCSSSEAPNKPTQTATTLTPEQASSPFLLSGEPEAAKSVIALRDEAKDGDEVVIEGRIGGDVNPWVEGRAAFQIVDRSLVPCNERAGDNCKTPWDYCCDADTLPKSKATIKFVDDDGKTISTDARKLLGLKELQTVVIKGQAKRDEAGNLTVLANGLFVKPVAPKLETGGKSP